MFSSGYYIKVLCDMQTENLSDNIVTHNPSCSVEIDTEKSQISQLSLDSKTTTITTLLTESHPTTSNLPYIGLLPKTLSATDVRFNYL